LVTVERKNRSRVVNIDILMNRRKSITSLAVKNVLTDKCENAFATDLKLASEIADFERLLGFTRH
jgi:hypothetical protein